MIYFCKEIGATSDLGVFSCKLLKKNQYLFYYLISNAHCSVFFVNRFHFEIPHISHLANTGSRGVHLQVLSDLHINILSPSA